MRILVVNDDGYAAAGIGALAAVAAEFGEATVVAPRGNCSGLSAALTTSGDIRIEKKGDALYAVSGTPADCVHVAMTGGFLLARPDMVISGINDGANLGDDTVYSGTVAAATVAHLFGIPAFAFSMAGHSQGHYATGAEAARRLLSLFCAAPPSVSPLLLNINIPDIALSAWRGLRLASLGRRLPPQQAVIKSAEAGGTVLALGGAGNGDGNGEGSDFQAVADGYAAVTPLMVDMTATAQMPAMAQWLR